MWLDALLRASGTVSTMVWVGGAVTGQIWMARARLTDDHATRAMLLPQINWIIRRVYTPWPQPHSPAGCSWPGAPAPP